jgi:hypothetical protein
MLKKASFSVTVPFIAEVDDYHEFKSLKRAYNQAGLSNLEIQELGLSEGKYLGLVYDFSDYRSKDLKEVVAKLTTAVENNEEDKLDLILGEHYENF